ncbi:DUF6325 family protein [Microbacterium halophytorum]|uniref:DUF6325 family protein n=1 Tax=Microbacterium halophytorum TaxID=2067568 RepID=UPI000CFDC617|nr:DUF6325 family protein [Microbacterium halophytorum]
MGAFASGRGYGPVELNVVTFEGATPSPSLLHALVEQVDAGIVRLLDFVLFAKSESGALSVTEIDLDEFSLADLAPLAHGLAAEEDLRELTKAVPAGTAGAVVALELTWASALAAQLAEGGSRLVSTVRIPATAVNTAVELGSDA